MRCLSLLNSQAVFMLRLKFSIYVRSFRKNKALEKKVSVWFQLRSFQKNFKYVVLPAYSTLIPLSFFPFYSLLILHILSFHHHSFFIVTFTVEQCLYKNIFLHIYIYMYVHMILTEVGIICLKWEDFCISPFTQMRFLSV